MGNSEVGSVVSHSLKSGWGLVIFSKAFSSCCSHRINRWQFCNINQCPRVEAVSKSCRASWRGGEITAISLSIPPTQNNKWTDLFLALTHGQKLEPIATVTFDFSQLPQFSSRVCPRTQNEDNGREWCWLVKDTVQANNWWSDILLTHTNSDKVGDGSVDPVYSETSQQHQGLEVTQAFPVFAWEGKWLRSIQIKPLQQQQQQQKSANIKIVVVALSNYKWIKPFSKTIHSFQCH